MNITLYTTSTCPHCARAKTLLDSKGLIYEEHVMDDAPRDLDAAKAKWNHSTVPIVIIDGVLIGGGSELAAYDQAGKLA
jgi:glutaredoxin 3